MCSSFLQKDMLVFYMMYFVAVVVLPVITIIYGTVRICIIVVRTHRQISALEQSISVVTRNAAFAVGTGNAAFVTAQAMLSSKNVIIICVMSLALNIPVLVCVAITNLTNIVLSDMLIFVSLWIFECNTVVNSLLYLFLYRSVRQKTAQMITQVIANVRAR